MNAVIILIYLINDHKTYDLSSVNFVISGLVFGISFTFIMYEWFLIMIILSCSLYLKKIFQSLFILMSYNWHASLGMFCKCCYFIIC